MDWKARAVEELKAYDGRCKSIALIAQRIRLLELECRMLEHPGSETEAGQKRREERLRENRAERRDLAANLVLTRELANLVEKGLDAIPAPEKRVLEGFYVNRQEGHLEKLCTEFGYEKSQMYRMKDTALHSFARAMFGETEC